MPRCGAQHAWQRTGTRLIWADPSHPPSPQPPTPTPLQGAPLFVTVHRDGTGAIALQAVGSTAHILMADIPVCNASAACPVLAAVLSPFVAIPPWSQ